MNPKNNPLNNLQFQAADMNGDGQIKASDYVLIKNYIMNE